MAESNDLNYKLEYMKRRLYQKKGRKPTVIELSEVLRISVEEVRQLNAPVGSPERAEAYARYLKELEVVRSAFAKKPELIEALTSKERQVIRMTLGLDDGHEHSASEISEILGLPPQTIWRTKRAAIHKIHNEQP